MKKLNYQGLKLTPSLFADILILLFDGKQFHRQDAISDVKQFFVDHGGSLENKDYVATFKKVAQNLKDCGLINRGYGAWVLTYNKKM